MSCSYFISYECFIKGSKNDLPTIARAAQETLTHYQNIEEHEWDQTSDYEALNRNIQNLVKAALGEDQDPCVIQISADSESFNPFRDFLNRFQEAAPGIELALRASGSIDNCLYDPEDPDDTDTHYEPDRYAYRAPNGPQLFLGAYGSLDDEEYGDEEDEESFEPDYYDEDDLSVFYNEFSEEGVFPIDLDWIPDNWK